MGKFVAQQQNLVRFHSAVKDLHILAGIELLRQVGKGSYQIRSKEHFDSNRPQSPRGTRGLRTSVLRSCVRIFGTTIKDIRVPLHATFCCRLLSLLFCILPNTATALTRLLRPMTREHECTVRILQMLCLFCGVQTRVAFRTF